MTSLEIRAFGSLFLALMVFVVAFLLLDSMGSSTYPALAIAALISFVIGVFFLRIATGRYARMTFALERGLLNFKDNDFSSSISNSKDNELNRLVILYNGVAESLRKERQHIYQRELLLDTVLQSSPLAMLLTDMRDRVIYSNREACHLLHQGAALNGLPISVILEQLPSSVAETIREQKEGLFTIQLDQVQHTYHLSCREFTLNTAKHHLYLFKQMTRDIHRNEVAVWKRVIRLISHELNNSLAPISSMAHSGKKMLDMPNNRDKLSRVFTTIAERAHYLDHFIQGYAKFSRLPAPVPQQINWSSLVETLQEQIEFSVEGDLPKQEGWADPSQLQQVLINLIKNAHEAEGPSEDVKLSVQVRSSSNQKAASIVNISVYDRGKGMSETEIAQALLPFYSTKVNGTGLGLALCLEVVDAHEGRIAIRNRVGGGVVVSIELANKLCTE